jgi:hypothetical protein
MVMKNAATLMALVCITLASAAAVSAARQPTRTERQAITNALPPSIRSMPVGCVWLDIRVSRNPKYGYVAPEALSTLSPKSKCLRYASNGFFILRKKPTGKWRVIFEGSNWPPCSRRIPRDLVGCDHS